MEILDRIVIRVLAVLLIVTAGLIGMTLWGDVLLINWVLSLQSSIFDGVILMLILVLFSLYLFFMATKPKEDDREVMHQTTLGIVRISVATISGLIVQAIEKFDGVKNVKVVINEVEPLKISIELQLLPDNNIPELSKSIQTEITNYLQNTVGISVESIDVLIKAIVADSSQKRDKSNLT